MNAPAMPRSQILQGMGFALIGFAILPFGDAVVKTMSGQWPGPAIAALRYFFGAVALAAILAVRQGRAGFRCPKPWVQFGRAFGVSISAAGFFAGVQLMPLSDMTAISFTSPIIVALLSSALLKEPPSRAIWLASGLAFVGMVILLRPNIATIGWAGVLPLISALGFAVMVVCNRMAAGSGSAMQMQMLISAFALPFLILIAMAGHHSGMPQFVITWPDWTVVARCAVVACTGSVAHTMLYLATERVSAGRTAPLAYSQLLIAVIIGAAFFGDIPDAVALVGAVIIVGAGLYLWRSEQITSS
jgi:drug/metabolite transporter (DMT)-like permease